MNIGWPQAIFLALMLVSLGHDLSQHGKPMAPQAGTYSAWGTIVAMVLSLALLWWGGFFD